MLDFEAYSELRRSANTSGVVVVVEETRGDGGWCPAVSCGELPGCGGYSNGAQNPAEEGLFRLGRGFALTAVAADELVVRGGVTVLAR